MAVDSSEQIARFNARAIARAMWQYFLGDQSARSLSPPHQIGRSLELILVAIVNGSQNDCGNRQHCQYDSCNSEWNVP